MTNDFIQNCKLENKRCLVHCKSGKSRSASIVLAYLIKSISMTYEEGLNFLRTIRPLVQPNYGFTKQLLEYEKELKHENKAFI